MDDAAATHDAVVIGGGFYGASIAIHLARTRGFERIALVEREASLLSRASYANQARVHNGYHYPRSFITAWRSRVNLPRFLRDWPQAVRRDFVKLYAIARRSSKVTARQFQRFCEEIGAPLEPAGPGLAALFDARLVERVFVAQEYAFDATRLAAWAAQELRECNVRLLLGTTAQSVQPLDGGGLRIALQSSGGAPSGALRARHVFNCTYSGLNQLSGAFPGTRTGLKHEITEMALVRVPAPLQDMGITLMDGPFFSLMPFPARGLHTLSHVRYTPHLNWADAPGVDPYARLAGYDGRSRVDRMLRDSARYLPALQGATHVDSLLEVKTVLAKSEGDDGRPILFERHAELPGCYSVLGGKIDNIYDVLERLDAEPLSLAAAPLHA